jgi:hypothetical protein
LKEFAKGRESGAKELHAIVNTIQRQVAKEILGAGEAYETGFLFAGYSKEGPFILECDRKGPREWHHGRNFAAIGSGDIFAVHAWRSVAHYDIGGLGLVQAQALAYRTIEDAVATAALGLGGQVQVCVASAGGAPHILDRAEIQAVEDLIKLWKAGEVEVLGGLAQTVTKTGTEPSDTPTGLPPEE